MLITPLGEIEISIDGKPIEYNFENVKLDEYCKDLSGRYYIAVKFTPDGKKHTIDCRIKGHAPCEKDYIESGERLELKSFFKGNTKLSIGVEWDFDLYDYEPDGYFDDGLGYYILPSTKTDEYIFGVAWLENADENNEIQTWFGADLFEIKMAF